MNLENSRSGRKKLGPEILNGEFEKVLAELKNAKDAGVDNIPEL